MCTFVANLKVLHLLTHGRVIYNGVNYPTLLTRGWGLKSKNSSDLICYHKDMQ
jgi:hypothetical protein